MRKGVRFPVAAATGPAVQEGGRAGGVGPVRRDDDEVDEKVEESIRSGGPGFRGGGDPVLRDLVRERRGESVGAHRGAPLTPFRAALRFGGLEFAASSEGALLWPERRAILVADLHLEKASWFAKGGQMLPPHDSIATLSRLAALAAAGDAREIWCLGDSFHDPQGCERLPPEARALLRSLTARARWIWITGNHDPEFAEHFGGRAVREAAVDGLILRHEADPDEPLPELSGHFHPKLRIRRRGHPVARRCFVATPTKLILPAFGALTGGLDARHPEIARAVGERAEALVPLDDRLLRFALAA